MDHVYDNHPAIKRLRHSARSLRQSQNRRLRELKARVAELEDDVASLTLTCRALLSTLSGSGGIDPAAFVEAARRIDLEDGEEDEK